MQNEHTERMEALLASAQQASSYGAVVAAAFRRVALARWGTNMLAKLREDVGSPHIHALAMLAAVARLAAALAGAQLALEFVVRARRNGQGIPGAIKREHAQELEELLRGVEPGHWADRDLGGGVINDEAVRIANEIVRDLWAAKLDGPEADMNRVLDCVVRSIGSV